MTLRPSQSEFGVALRAVELTTVVYKPPDDARNWKPCDFMVWLGLDAFPRHTAWFEVKDVKDLRGFPFAELRPSQLQGISDAARIGFPYWLAVWWRRQREWTISDAVRVIAWRDSSDRSDDGIPPTSIPRELLISRFGISSTKQQLSGTLKAVLLGEVD